MISSQCGLNLYLQEMTDTEVFNWLLYLLWAVFQCTKHDRATGIYWKIFNNCNMDECWIG